MVLSLLNLPEPAALRILILIHFSGSTNALSAAAYFDIKMLHSDIIKKSNNMDDSESPQKNKNEVDSTCASR